MRRAAKRPDGLARRHHDHLYVIATVDTSVQLVKIGRTIDPERRLRHMEGGSPLRLRILRVFERCGPLEPEVHARFEAQHDHGEWFAIGSHDEALAAVELVISELTESVSQVVSHPTRPQTA